VSQKDMSKERLLVRQEEPLVESGACQERWS
jgi:hypothetical protein